MASTTAATAVTIHPNYNTSAASPLLPGGVVCADGMRSRIADYIAIATEALNRGFRITPVHPLEKRGVLYNWNRQPTTTLSEVLQHAKDFPNHNVGIVGRRGVGNHCFLDIDADGVVERIEQETGQKMPVTYTVCSRPQTAPWKKHFYFRQTAYSISRLRKEANRKDTTKQVISDNGTPVHPSEYDLKGVGGGGLVVGAGSVRKDGEIYTVLNDVPVLDIPTWLVDWLVEDLSKYRSACSKERYERAMKVAAMPEEVRTVRQEQGDESAFDISESDIYEFLNWRAFQFAAMGTEGKLLEKVLFQQVEKFCAGGKKFLQSDGGKRQIHKAAFNKRLKVGNASFFNRLGQKKKAALGGGLKLSAGPPTRKGLMVAAMRSFPESVTSEDGYHRLQTALAGTGFTVDRKTKAGQKAVQEARKVAGFHAEQTSAGWMWVRIRSNN
jgi:Bifunctional DNA primase/polymerase, N-terminal